MSELSNCGRRQTTGIRIHANRETVLVARQRPLPYGRGIFARSNRLITHCRAGFATGYRFSTERYTAWTRGGCTAANRYGLETT
ncbi:hypothetical protein D9M69_574290 [compost metagenome]